MLVQHNETRVITHVGVETKAGIYAPVSMNGVLIVDGVAVSAYIDFKASGWVNTARSLGVTPTIVSHVSISYHNHVACYVTFIVRLNKRQCTICT